MTRLIFFHGNLSKTAVLLFIVMLFSCVDQSPLEEGDLKMGEQNFASGPQYGNYYSFSRGIINAVSETEGLFLENRETEGSLENARMLVRGNTFFGDAYMGLMQEDVFEFARSLCEKQFSIGPEEVDIELLRIASMVKVIMAMYREDVYLLVNTSSADDFEDLNRTDMVINLGTENSGTYVTSKTILDAHRFTYSPRYDDPEAAVEKVVSGEYDAAFYVCGTPAPIIQNIPADAPVRLISVNMPEGLKTYDENGVIPAEYYAFQDSDVTGNIAVKTLLAVGPNYSNKKVKFLIDYIYANSADYAAYNSNWEKVSRSLSLSYMAANPMKCDYGAMCHLSGFEQTDPFFAGSFFYSGTASGSAHLMSSELISLLARNMGIYLVEKNSTGSWENSYRVMNGFGLMAIVQDDLFSSLAESLEMYDAMQAASMVKIAPLYYEYVHLLINKNAGHWTDSGYPAVPASLEDIFTDPAWLNPEVPEITINIGPKTSGTFVTAMKIISSYRNMNTRADDEPELCDMDHMKINYRFDDPYDAVLKVDSGEYDAVFVVSSAPYERFYSHDTWAIGLELADCMIIPALFHGDVTPAPYFKATLKSGGTADYEDYPYVPELLPGDIETVALRSLHVASAVYDDTGISAYIKSLFRKSYYKTNPVDSGLWPDTYPWADSTYWTGYQPDPLWIPVQKESSPPDAGRARYEKTVGAMEYFVINPFGWSREAAEYYLSLFE